VDAKVLRLVAVVAGIAIIAAAFLLKSGGGSSSSKTTAGSTTKAQPAPHGSLVISVAYSPEKEPLLHRAFTEFNARKVQVGGKPVFVQGTNVASGAALDQLQRGTLKPTIWSPSSSLWGRLLTEQADVPWVPESSRSFVRTPLVIAMWQDEAKALGYPGKPLGFGDILAEARNTAGWGRYGHPEWGAFRLGHTNPDFSTSGLSAVAAEYYAATGKTEGLTLADVSDPAVRAKIREIESSIVHYGDTTLFFSDQLAKRGKAFASAVAMEEVTLVAFDQKASAGRKLVALYPKEGTFFSDDPMIVLNAPWVSAEQKLAAKQLIDYLLSGSVQSRVGEYGFRPSDPQAQLGSQLGPANGVDPRQPTRLLSLPDPNVLGKIKELWHEDRKPADIELVLDTSGSMGGETRKLEQAQKGLHAFLAQLSPRDRVGLVSFADAPIEVAPLREMTPANVAALGGAIDGLFANGGTSVYDSTLAGLRVLSTSGQKDHIQAEVVLTDGVDNKSSSSIDDVLGALGTQSESGGVRVFTIAYGTDANASVLARIAAIGGGKPYTGNPQNIDEVYTSISSFF